MEIKTRVDFIYLDLELPSRSFFVFILYLVK